MANPFDAVRRTHVCDDPGESNKTQALRTEITVTLDEGIPTEPLIERHESGWDGERFSGPSHIIYLAWMLSPEPPWMG